MPKPRRHQATLAPRVSIPPSLRACVAVPLEGWLRRVAQALEHEGKGDATGS